MGVMEEVLLTLIDEEELLLTLIDLDIGEYRVKTESKDREDR